MEFLKQLWSNSPWVRVLAIVAAVGMVLAVATAGGTPDGFTPPVPDQPGILKKLPIPAGGGLPSKAKKAAESAADVAGKAVDTTGKVIDATGKAAERVGDWIDGK